MMFDFRYPNITGKSTAEKVAQIGSYLHQFVEQLQWAMDSINTNTNVIVSPASNSSKSAAPTANTAIDSQATFNAIKSLIIKSADIVEAYYDVIEETLVGQYTALSEFGTFKEETKAEFLKSSTGLDQVYTHIQTVSDDINAKYDGQLDDVKGELSGVKETADDANNYIIEMKSHIRTGLLADGVYGIEVGQKSTVNGVEKFNKYARFTADKLSFYDQNNAEVAYISDRKLYITHAEVTGTLKLGGYLVDTTNGLTFKWVGRG
jgi:hypothetical protein